MVSIWLFFEIYFLVPTLTPFSALVLPSSSLDHLLPVWDLAFLPYVSLWIYLSLAPALAADRSELVAFGLSAAAMAVIGLAFFYLIPTQLPPGDVQWSTYPLLSAIKTADPGMNAFPSLHVGFAELACLVISQQLRAMAAGWPIRFANQAWCVAIVLSTLLTRQHVLVDVAGGALLAYACWSIYRCSLPRGHLAAMAWARRKHFMRRHSLTQTHT